MELELFGNKIEMALERIKSHCPPEGYYVAFSGGKDSSVLLDLVKQSGVKYDAHYNFTGIDPPELTRFIKDNYPEVKKEMPEKTMWQLIVENRFPPTRIMRYCCGWLKERGGDGRFVLTGIRWKEGPKRAKRKMVEACNKNKGKFFLHPIIDWTENEVWHYIKHHKMSYCSLYDEGYKRLGCIMCPMKRKKGMIRDAERWPKFAEAFRKACHRSFEKRIRDGLKTKNWQSGDDMYNWWVYGQN